MAEANATAAPRRDYSMFDAELSGAVLNLSLLRRLLRWMKPYRVTFFVSAVLILLASTLQVMQPVIISVVVIDHIIRQESETLAPDLGLVDLTDWVTADPGRAPAAGMACLLYAIVYVGWAVIGHAHRLTLISSVINGLRDLRQDLFSTWKPAPPLSTTGWPWAG